MFTLIYEKRVFKDLDRILNADAGRIIPVIKQLAHDPTPKDCKKLKTKSDLFRIRQGDYRIIYEIDRVNKQARVLCVRHRKDAYKEPPQ